MVYVRQSTVAQTHVNTESLERQYELVSRAVELGWERSGVKVIDEDLGRSGADASRRTGFQALVADVGLGRVGLVLGIEVSRLERRNADWYHLLDLCAVTGTLNCVHLRMSGNITVRFSFSTPSRRRLTILSRVPSMLQRTS